MQDLSFMSFEHYPYQPCTIQWSDLYDEPTYIAISCRCGAMMAFRKCSHVYYELNIAWNSGESFVDTFGALWLADFAGAFSRVAEMVFTISIIYLGSFPRLQRFDGNVWHVQWLIH